MNKVFLVGRLTRDPELRTLPSGKPVANFVVATNEFRGNGAPERTEYHNLVAWDRLAEICGQFLSKGQLVDVEGRLQTRQWDDDGGVRYCQVEPMPCEASNTCPTVGHVFYDPSREGAEAEPADRVERVDQSRRTAQLAKEGPATRDE